MVERDLSQSGWIFIALIGIMFSWMENSNAAERPPYVIKPNPTLAVQCETEEGRIAYWQSLKESDRADIGFQALSLGLDPKEYEQAFISDQCNLARDGMLETYERTSILGGAPLWYCEAKWNEKCKTDKVVAEAPNGWQICGVTYDVAVDRGDTRFEAEPRLLLPDQPEGRRRFRQLAMWLDVRGKGAILDQKSSHLRIRNLLVTMVPDHWPDSARIGHRCIIPPPPRAAPPPAPRPSPANRPIPARVTRMFQDEGRSFRFGLTNDGTVPTTMAYEVFLTTTYAPRRSWGQGTITVQPGTTYLSDGYHNWDATAWDVKAVMIP